MKIEAVDNGIVGEAAYYYNITIRSKLTVEPNTPRERRSKPDMLAIRGGVTGSVAFLGLAVIIYFFLMRKIRKRRQNQVITVSSFFELITNKKTTFACHVFAAFCNMVQLSRLYHLYYIHDCGVE